jgi:Fe-S cluster biogenesis protein NfuA
VELLEIAESTVRVRLTTRSSGCGVATLKQAVERSIYENAPEVAEVIAEQNSILPAPQLVQLR